MKRFWLEEQWHWTTANTMTPRIVPGATIYYVFTVLLLLHFVPSLCKVGEECDLHKLNQCSVNEKCEEVKSSGMGVCKCMDHFVEDKATGKCEEPKPPPEPSGNHLGLGLGLGLTMFLVLVGAALFALHRKFGLLSGMCQCLPSFQNLFGIRSGDINMMDDQDDDVNPIV